MAPRAHDMNPCTAHAAPSLFLAALRAGALRSPTSGTIASTGPAAVAGSSRLRCRAEWLDRIGLRGEQRKQPGVDEEFLTSRLLLAEQAGRDESLQVARSRLPPGDSSLDYVRDPAVRLLEHEIDQFPTVDLWCRGPDVLDGFGHELANRADLRRRPGSRLFDALEYEQNPWLLSTRPVRPLPSENG